MKENKVYQLIAEILAIALFFGKILHLKFIYLSVLNIRLLLLHSNRNLF